MPSRLFEGLSGDEALLRTRQLLSALNGVVWEADASTGELTFVSPHAQRVLGYPASAWTTRGFWEDHLHADDRAGAVHARRAALRERRDHEIEYRMVAADGSVAWLRDLVSVTMEPDGDVRVRGLIVDISAQKRTELALRRTTQELEKAQRLARVGSFTHDLASGVIALSPQSRAMFGIGAEGELTFAGFLRHVHPDDAAGLARHLDHAFASGQTNFSVDYRYQRPGGELQYFTGTGEILRDRTGIAVRVFGSLQDVSEQRRAELAGLAHVRFLESLDLVNLAIQGATDLDQMMAEVFDAMLAIFECDRAWLVRRTHAAPPCWQIAVERHRPEFPGAGPGHVFDPSIDRLFGRALATREPFHYTPPSPGAPPHPHQQRFQIRSQVCVAVSPNEATPFVLGLHHCRHAHAWTPSEERLLQEIGRRLADALGVVLAHEALLVSEQRLADAQRLTHTGYWERDFATHRLTVSPETLQILAAPTDEPSHDLAASEEFWRSRIHPDDLDRVDRVSAAAMAEGRPYEVEYRVVLPSGDVRHVRTLGKMTSDAPGRPARWFGTLQDLTALRVAEHARPRAQHAADRSHALMRAIVEGTSDAISVKDLQGRYLLVNAAFADLHGRTVDELVGTRDAAAGAAGLSDDDRTGLASGEPRTYEQTITIDGAARTFHTAQFAYWDASDAPIGLIGVWRETTELKHLEEALRQSQKMEAIGRLAGGVAHTFNNLLTVILGYTEVMSYGFAADDPNRDATEQIMKSAGRAAAVARQLLSFSRKQALTPQVVHLPTALEDLRALLRPLIAEDIELTVHAAVDLGPVTMDAAQFEQALTNLVVNASDAMPRGGRLRIEAVDLEITPHSPVHPALVKPGRYVEVRVWDSGHGMDETTRDRIFEPFFTTKPLGTGTGLGLATVYGFVTQTGGHIDVTSTPGGGTLFRLLLPCSAGVPGDEARVAAAGVSSTRGTETVLIAEDEEAVRAVATLMLEMRGYRVLEAGDGVDALAVARAHPGRIDLLLSDLVMPRMNGRELAATLIAEQPQLRVLLMSGYPDDIVPDDAVDPRFEFLRKPFQPSALARRVRDALDRRLD